MATSLWEPDMAASCQETGVASSCTWAELAASRPSCSKVQQKAQQLHMGPSVQAPVGQRTESAAGQDSAELDLEGFQCAGHDPRATL